MLPLLKACRLSPSIFDQRYHKFYNFPKNNLRRGGEQYIQPLSWAAYGINVQGNYDFGDNTWLGNKNLNGEFAVAYYGINNLFNLYHGQPMELMFKETMILEIILGWEIKI